MGRLMSANFLRLFRSIIFWICLAVMLCFGIIIAVNFIQSNPWCREQISWETLYVSVRNVPWLSIILALFISLWVGVEYSDKTIRNKIAVGHSKRNIYFVNWLVCTVASVLLFLVYFLTVALPIAPWGKLMKYNRNIIASFAKRATLDLFAVIALASVFVFIAMLMKNRILGLAVTIMTAFLLLFVADSMCIALTEPEYLTIVNSISGEDVQKLNPDYISGIKRGLLQIITDVQPLGQMQQVVINTVGGVKGLLLPLYSCIITLLTLGGGMFLIGKKDLE